jgi:spermidine/putrescine-binding protein
MAMATWGGSYTAAIREMFLIPFTRETGIPTATVDAPGDFVRRLREQFEVGQIMWDIAEGNEWDALTLIGQGIIVPLPELGHEQLVQAVGEQKVTNFGVAIALDACVGACRGGAAESSVTLADVWDTMLFPGARGLNRHGSVENLALALMADGVPEHELLPFDIPRGLRKIEELHDAGSSGGAPETSHRLCSAPAASAAVSCGTAGHTAFATPERS